MAEWPVILSFLPFVYYLCAPRQSVRSLLCNGGISVLLPTWLKW